MIPLPKSPDPLTPQPWPTASLGWIQQARFCGAALAVGRSGLGSGALTTSSEMVGIGDGTQVAGGGVSAHRGLLWPDPSLCPVLEAVEAAPAAPIR